MRKTIGSYGRVKPNRCKLGEETEDDRTHQAATAFLEEFGTWQRGDKPGTWMEIWIHKSGGSPATERIEAVWEAWRRDSPKDECIASQVQLEDQKKSGWQART